MQSSREASERGSAAWRGKTRHVTLHEPSHDVPPVDLAVRSHCSPPLLAHFCMVATNKEGISKFETHLSDRPLEGAVETCARQHPMLPESAQLSFVVSGPLISGDLLGVHAVVGYDGPGSGDWKFAGQHSHRS